MYQYNVDYQHLPASDHHVFHSIFVKLHGGLLASEHKLRIASLHSGGISMPMVLEVNKTNSIQLKSIFSRLHVVAHKNAHVQGVLWTVRRILHVIHFRDYAHTQPIVLYLECNVIPNHPLAMYSGRSS